MILHDFEGKKDVLMIHDDKITTIHTGDREFIMDPKNLSNCITFERFVKQIGRGFSSVQDMIVGVDDTGENIIINFGKLDINHIWVDIFVDNVTHHYTRVYGVFPEEEWS